MQAGGAGLEVGTHGCAGVVTQSGGLVNVNGYNVFSVGGGIIGRFAGTGTYSLSAGPLNTGFNGGYSEIGTCGGTGVMTVSGSGVWNVADDLPGSTVGNGGGQLCIGSGDNGTHLSGTGTVNIINGGTVNAFGGVTIGDVFSHGGARGCST